MANAHQICRTALLALIASGICAALASTAAAQTPTYGTFDLRFGGYYPKIDEEPGLDSTPFEDTFGARDRLMLELQVGVHLLEGVGKFGVAGSLGYTSFEGDALLSGPTEAFDDDGNTPTTSFVLVPLRASVYYQFDWLVEAHNVPLAAVARAGLDAHWWRVRDGNDDIAEFDGQAASGLRPGWHASLALQLWLDWIDRESAAYFDLNWGINNTYLFAEYLITRVDGFGSEGFLLDDEQWVFGLSFEY